MEPTMKAQRKKWVQSLASLARELKVQAVRDDAKRQAVTAMVERLRKSKAAKKSTKLHEVEELFKKYLASFDAPKCAPAAAAPTEPARQFRLRGTRKDAV